MTDEHNTKTRALLTKLGGADSSAAWSELIDRVSPLIMSIVNRFEFEQERRNDCFLFICEKLYKGNFSKLKQFNTHSQVRFKSWLSIVVFNLCVDWHRSEFGRVVMLPSVAALPAFDREVYRFCVEQGMSKESCFEQLKPDFPDLNLNLVSASLERIYKGFTPRQRWQLSVKQGRRATAVNPETLVESNPGPESEASSSEERLMVKKAMNLLEPEQRLLLVLRFREGLTFERIAKMENLGDAHRARRRVNKVLDLLHRQLSQMDPKKKRQN